MANSLNFNASINANINGLIINESGNSNLTPQGSTVLAESTLVALGQWTLILTGSNFGTASMIYCENTSQTGSISLALSASNVVNNLGTIAVLPSNNTTGIPTAIQWNNTFQGLYAMSNISASNGIFVVASQ